MTLCVIIGNDDVGKYVAANILSTEPNALLVGVFDTRDWLEINHPNAGFLKVLKFGQLSSILRENGTKEIIFAGGISNSRKVLGSPDKMTLKYLKQRNSLQLPHAYLHALKSMLTDLGITIKSVLDYLPELGLTENLTFKVDENYNPTTDMEKAQQCTRSASWKKVSQAHIVDQGEVLMSESKLGTDTLICSFGEQFDRSTAKYPVLCNVAASPFDNIMPATIGRKTAVLCIRYGIKAIAIQSGKTIVMDKVKLTALVGQRKISILVK